MLTDFPLLANKGNPVERRLSVLNDTRNYELMFIVNPDLGEEEVTSLLQRVQRYVENADGTVFKLESWGLRRLAYPIQHKREGRYYLMHMALNPRKVGEFERSLLLLEGVMRELITRYEGPLEPPEAPSPQVQGETSEAEAGGEQVSPSSAAQVAVAEAESAVETEEAEAAPAKADEATEAQNTEQET